MTGLQSALDELIALQPEGEVALMYYGPGRWTACADPENFGHVGEGYAKFQAEGKTPIKAVRACIKLVRADKRRNPEKLNPLDAYLGSFQ